MAMFFLTHRGPLANTSIAPALFSR